MMQFLLVLLAVTVVNAEKAKPLDKDLVKEWKFDFAIPDIPAFQALGIEPDVILRPSDAKALALMLGEQTLRNGVLPESYAAEIAPGLLIGAGNLTLAQYRAASWLYNTRVSVGSSRKPDTTGTTQVGFGLRTTIYNEGDLKRDTVFGSAVNRVLGLQNEERDSLVTKFLTDNDLNDSDRASNPEIRLACSRYVKEKVAARTQLGRDSVQILRATYKQQNWNKRSMDVGGAALLESPDSLTKNVDFRRLNVWLTAGFPAGSTQILAGGSYSYGLVDSAWRHSLSVGARWYGGSNNAKGFAELGYKLPVSGDGQRVEGSLGGEFLLLDGAWIALTVTGGKEIGGAWTLAPSLEYRFTLPESFTKF
jgi:hypothetical protein